MTKPDEIDSRLNRVYNKSGDKQSIFDDWAETYDHDLVNDLGYVADAVASSKFMSMVPDKHGRILDAGCGTGLVGRRLKEAGYTNIHGKDYSAKMLDEARATGAYQSLEQHDLTLPIEVDEPYAAAIAVGVFGFSGPAAQHFVNITCSLKPGGIAIFTVNGKAWVEAGWESKLSGFNENNRDIQLVEIETIDYLTADHIDGRLLTLKKQ